MSDEQVNYVRATRKFVAEDYPLGGSQRGVASFEVERNKNGERCVRVTDNGVRLSAPKKTTYGSNVAILIGDDGKTYIGTIGKHYPGISILRSNLSIQQESVSENDTRYARLVEMIKSAV